ILLVGDAHVLADALVSNDFIGRLAQHAGARDRKLPHHRIELPLVPDRAAEPTILLEMARRMRHHAKDIGVTILAQKLARAIVVFCGIAVVDAGHFSPWSSRPLPVFWCMDLSKQYRAPVTRATSLSQIAAALLFDVVGIFAKWGL